MEDPRVRSFDLVHLCSQEKPHNGPSREKKLHDMPRDSPTAKLCQKLFIPKRQLQNCSSARKLVQSDTVSRDAVRITTVETEGPKKGRFRQPMASRGYVR